MSVLFLGNKDFSEFSSRKVKISSIIWLLATQISPRMGYVFAISFSIFMILSLAPQIQVAYAGGKSSYESGYDHGCDNADEDFNDRYIHRKVKNLNSKNNEY